LKNLFLKIKKFNFNKELERKRLRNVERKRLGNLGEKMIKKLKKTIRKLG